MNTKNSFFLFFFEISHFFSKNSFLRIIGFPIRILYKITIQWILCIDISDKTKIGNRFQLYHGQGIVIHEDTVIGDNVIIRQNTTIGIARISERPPRICNNVNIGANSVIIGDIIIGENSIIGAGSVVIKNVPPNSLVVGNPAEVVKKIK
jgi:serine acetyltransferase